MQLVADRFATRDGGDVIDLSCGRSVELIVSTATAGTEQTRWAVRCGRFAGLHHHAIARLVDYGAVGETRRFEAWDVDGPWRGSQGEADRALDLAQAYLRACSLTAAPESVGQVRTGAGRALVVPDGSSGYETRSVGEPAVDAPLEARGLQSVHRSSVAALVELVEDVARSRPAAISVRSARRAGLHTAVQEVARAARSSGFVPIAVGRAPTDLYPLIVGRSLLLIVEGDVRAGWRALLSHLLDSPKPHVLLFVGASQLPSVPSLVLERLTIASLRGALSPSPCPAGIERRVASAARRCGGLPGRFADLLWPGSRIGIPAIGTRLPRAAEQTAAYGLDATAADPVAASPVVSAWPAPGELTALRHRLDAGMRELRRGRHARGNRMVRDAVGCLTRRHDAEPAARGGLALAESLIKRGHVREALTLLAAAKERAVESRNNELLVAVAVATGTASIDLARLDEAEAVLQGACMAARGTGQPASLMASALALARCLFWRGSYDEADSLLTRDELEVPTPAGADLSRMRARIAVGRGDLPTAVRLATAALRATGPADSAAGAAAAYVSAFAHLAVGDDDAVHADVARCVAASRHSRDPLLAIRARLLAAESARRTGRHSVATALIRRVRRIDPSRLPPIVAARASLLTELIEVRDPAGVVTRHVRLTNLPALALFAPVPRAGGGAAGATIDEIVEILRCCQSSDDDAVVLGQICARLRSRLHASSVAFLVEERGLPVPLACDGARADAAIAARVMALGQTIAPHRVDDRIEGGAPVRCGGKLIGALVARWSIAACIDLSGAAALLTTGATAAAPAVAGALARRTAAVTGARSDLHGTSGLIVEVNRAIERAAPAPFSVLVEGESGCGKELVARALHRRSARRDRAFSTLNCAALPDDLAESELFGHARGAFTGAVADRPGVFEEASTGTLFLDEIGELSLRAQAKVLRTIQEGELRRVGENVARRIDVRLIAATNRDLRQEVSAGRFRLDLLYRIDVIRIVVPPLRDRREDIPVLVDPIWREATARVGSRATLAMSTIAALARYDWPGNVRELQNVLAALAVRSSKRGVVPPSALPPHFATACADRSWRLEEARRTFDERFIRAALARAGGHRARAAEEIGVTRQGLTKLMMRLGISESAVTP